METTVEIEVHEGHMALAKLKQAETSDSVCHCLIAEAVFDFFGEPVTLAALTGFHLQDGRRLRLDETARRLLYLFDQEYYDRLEELLPQTIRITSDDRK